MMNDQPTTVPQVVGVSPWLPWPFSAWPWCNVPVRAERLAALRIGIALCLLVDIAFNYVPGMRDFLMPDSTAAAVVGDWRFDAPRTTWNLLRGLPDETNLHLALGIWLLAGGWMLLNSFARLGLLRYDPPLNDRTGIALVLAVVGHAWYSGSVWSRIVADREPSNVAWIVPMLGLSGLCLWLTLELATRLRDPAHPVSWWGGAFGFAAHLALLGFGAYLAIQDGFDDDAWWAGLFHSWQSHDTMIVAAMSLWIGCVILLLVGCCTKFAAIMVWTLGISFGNLNPNIENAGDTIRAIILFYLMLCPCGAAWSIDAWRRRTVGPVFVHPWAIRLLFLQMIFIYSMNGYYKMFGATWLTGDSLHYVLGDVALTRFSRMLLPIPIEITRMLTWTVLGWEVMFPALVLWKWTRRPALFFGVMFHLGIFATMELAGFPLYAICLYLPLVPWEWWLADQRETLDSRRELEG